MQKDRKKNLRDNKGHGRVARNNLLRLTAQSSLFSYFSASFSSTVNSAGLRPLLKSSYEVRAKLYNFLSIEGEGENQWVQKLKSAFRYRRGSYC